MLPPNLEVSIQEQAAETSKEMKRIAAEAASRGDDPRAASEGGYGVMHIRVHRYRQAHQIKRRVCAAGLVR